MSLNQQKRRLTCACRMAASFQTYGFTSAIRDGVFVKTSGFGRVWPASTSLEWNKDELASNKAISGCFFFGVLPHPTPRAGRCQREKWKPRPSPWKCTHASQWGASSLSIIEFHSIIDLEGGEIRLAFACVQGQDRVWETTARSSSKTTARKLPITQHQ